METLQHLILHDMPDSEEIEAVKSGAHTLTYKSYRKRINQLANALLQKGIQKRRPYCIALQKRSSRINCYVCCA